MENKLATTLDDFIGVPETTGTTKVDNSKVVLGKKTGLIERVDKIYVTEDGRQLLREQY
jgi:hypothetical protein